MPLAEKLCPVCGVVKPLTDFCIIRIRPDGRADECKPCRSAYMRRWRAKNRKAPPGLTRQQLFAAGKRTKRPSKRETGKSSNRQLDQMSEEARMAMPDYAALLEPQPLPWELRQE